MSDLAALWSVSVLMLLGLVLARSARRLAEAQWPLRAPGLGIVAWQAVTAGLALCLVLAGCALLIPSLPALAGLLELLQWCSVALGSRLRSWDTALVSAIGIAVVVAPTGRFLTAYLREQRSVRARRRQHRERLSLVAVERPDGVVVIDAGTPAVYCVPGRGGHIVATRGALEALDPEQLESVLAHERFHLRARHHSAISVARVLARSFACVRTFQLAATHIAQLVEMQADDAAGPAGRRHLAMALLDLTEGPSLSLSAGGDTLRRATRLAQPMQPLSLLTRCIIAGLASAALAAPIAVGLLPVPSSTAPTCCLGDDDALLH